MRVLLFVFGAAAFTLSLFWVMQQMISGPSNELNPANAYAQIDFIRLQQDSRTELKDRRRSEPPKPQQPQMPQQSVSQNANIDAPKLDVSIPNIAMDMGIGVAQHSMLGDAVVGMGFGDTDVIPLVRVSAQYPQRAIRQKIEGVVTARLFINPEGTVDNVEIVQAEPRGVFEREAMRALYRYKFKPKMEGGHAVAQIAIQTIEFKLGE